MDCEVEILHSVSVGDLKSQESIQVNISAQFNRLQIPQQELELERRCQEAEGEGNGNDGNSYSDDQIETIWQRRILENPKLFNGTKFRVHSIHASTLQREKVDINVGVTDYKTFLGTNWAANVVELQSKGSRLHNNSQVFLSDALGVGSFLVLSDDCMVLLKRNVHCAEASNKWDVPGGHAEPKNIVGDIPLEDIDASSVTGEQVCSEIFNSILQEIEDEVNIPMSKLDRPLYMGTAKNTTSGGRPSLEFLTRCSLSSEKVHANYSKGSQLEADESTNIKFIPLEEVGNLQRDNTELWNSLAPSAKGYMLEVEATTTSLSTQMQRTYFSK